jgi:hypothetical protein
MGWTDYGDERVVRIGSTGERLEVVESDNPNVEVTDVFDQHLTDLLVGIHNGDPYPPTILRVGSDL